MTTTLPISLANSARSYICSIVARGDVEVVALDLARLRHRPVDALHAEQEAVAPLHERLRVDVLVVLGEVQAPAAGLVDHPPVVVGGQAELRLDGRAQQRAAVLAEVLALHHDPVRRAGEGLDVGDRDPHVLEPQRLQRLEPEHVADDRRGQVSDGPLLEQVEVVGDVGEVLARPAGRGVDPVALGLVVIVRRQPVGPHHGPRRGRGLACDRGTRLDRVHPRLRRHPEHRQHVGVLRHVVRRVVTHARVAVDAGVPAGPGRVLGGHGSSSSVGWLQLSAWDPWTSIDCFPMMLERLLRCVEPPSCGAAAGE